MKSRPRFSRPVDTGFEPERAELLVLLALCPPGGNNHTICKLVAQRRAAAARVREQRENQRIKVAGGFAKDGSVQDQIDATIEDAVNRVRDRLPRGESRGSCAECGAGIPLARREAIPGVRLCVKCQAEHDKESAAFSGYNRRGSKDSQLR